MQKLLTNITSRIYLFLGYVLAAYCTIRYRKTLRNKIHVFVNYFAFGHSIINSFSFLYKRGSEHLCVSLGPRSVRNKYVGLFLPKYSYLLITIPNFLGIPVYSRIGPYFTGALRSIVKHLERNCKSVFDDFRKASLMGAKEILLEKLQWNELEIEQALTQLVDISKENHPKAGEDIGSEIFMLFADRIAVKQENPLFSAINVKSFATTMELDVSNFLTKGSDVTSQGFFTIILRRGTKMHHGNGLETYKQLIDNFIDSRGEKILFLGDTEDVLIYREGLDEKRADRLFVPQDFNLHSNIVDIFALYFSDYVLGDSSGVWSLFTLFGRRGFRVNNVPIMQFASRTVSLPKRWIGVSESLVTKDDLNELAFFTPRKAPRLTSRDNRFELTNQEPNLVAAAVIADLTRHNDLKSSQNVSSLASVNPIYFEAHKRGLLQISDFYFDSILN